VVRHWLLTLEPFFFVVSLGGVRLSPLGTSATVGLLYQPRMIDDDYAANGGMRLGRGNWSTRRKPAPVPLYPPQIPHDLGSSPGRRGGKPATNRLSYGTAPPWSLGFNPCKFMWNLWSTNSILIYQHVPKCGIALTRQHIMTSLFF
jgi:hypothetical protein